MITEQKKALLDKLLPHKDKIYLDYVSFYANQPISPTQLNNEWEKGLIKTQDVQFYVHIPFCSRICTYCMYNTIEINTVKEIDDYIDCLISYLDIFKSTFSQTTFQGLYIGGGTPSLLSSKQMERLFSYIFKHFQFDDNYYRTIECNPCSTTFEKLDVLKKYGFSRVSFGVQSFNRNTLDKENRTYTSPKRIGEIVQYAQDKGFEDINIDLILGLNVEGEQDVLSSLKKIKESHPYSITVYTILQNMEKSIIFQKDPKHFYENVKQIYGNILEGSEILEKYNNYEWSHTLGFKLVSKKYPNILESYEAHSKEKKSLFAVGHKAFGKIWGLGTYENTIFGKKGIEHNFKKLTVKHEMYMYILKEFQFKLDKQDFREKFGEHIENKFTGEIKYLKDNGIIKEDIENIFYVGDKDLIGYYGLFFLDFENIIRFIKYRHHEK